MTSAVRTELTLSANAGMQRLVQDYVRALAELAGFTAEQGDSLALAVWEACDDCIEHAFDDDDEAGAYSVVGELTPAALTLAVDDRGLPYRQPAEPVEPQPEAAGSPQACLRGRGLSLAQQAADEVRWINRGPEGNELRLTKYRLGVCTLPTPLTEGANHHRQPAQAGAQNYLIRPLCPEDAVQVAQLMYRVYGYSYTNEDFYYPERLNHDLATGTHVGVVAVAENGEIVGHAGVMRPDLGPLAELGQLAVAPAHRGHDLNKLMGDLLQEEIRRLGLVGLYGEAVTLHTISQEASERRDLRVSGLKLLDWQAHFKKFQEGRQRESMVLYFKYLTPPGRAMICAPSRHRQILAKIYGNLTVDVEFMEPSGPTGPGQVAVHFDRDTGVGTIQVNRIGIDTLPEIYQARRDLCDIAGAAVVGLDLPLAQGSAPYLSDAAEADGFFFSGVRPHFAPDGDFLRLQYLNAELDLERLHLYAPFARELLAYILQEKARVEQR